jgi:hypothetical protein
MVRRYPFSIYAATCLLLQSLLLPSSVPAQDFMERSHKQQGPPPEVKPKIDEKAYKAALEKIPAPREKYDPWGAARPTDAKAAKKPN